MISEEKTIWSKPPLSPWSLQEGRHDNRGQTLPSWRCRMTLACSILALISTLATATLVTGASREYCQFETFNATCPANHVIVMEEARYGRLELGRCVTRDYGYLGCSANVLDLLDRECSGQQFCLVGVPSLRELVQPCPKDLTLYLAANYKCVKVIDVTSLRCNESFHLDPADPAVYIQSALSFHETTPASSPTPPINPPDAHTPRTSANDVTSDGAIGRGGGMGGAGGGGCQGSLFSTSPGQKIGVTLYSFSQYQNYDTNVMGGGHHDVSIEVSDVTGGVSSQSGGRAPPCPISAQIFEGVKRHVIGLCQLRHREQHLLTTNGSIVRVSVSEWAENWVKRGIGSGGEKADWGASKRGLTGAGSGGRRANYLLKLEATGCPDIVTPANAWVERFDDRVIVRCNFSQETWYLTCKDTGWVGTVTNCSEVLAIHDDEIKTSLRAKTVIPFGLVIAVVIGIVLGVILGLVMLISVFVYRRRQVRSPVFKVNALLGPEDASLGDSTEDTTAAAAAAAAIYVRHTCPTHGVQLYSNYQQQLLLLQQQQQQQPKFDQRQQSEREAQEEGGEAEGEWNCETEEGHVRHVYDTSHLCATYFKPHGKQQQQLQQQQLRQQQTQQQHQEQQHQEQQLENNCSLENQILRGCHSTYIKDDQQQQKNQQEQQQQQQSIDRYFSTFSNRPRAGLASTQQPGALKVEQNLNGIRPEVDINVIDEEEDGGSEQFKLEDMRGPIYSIQDIYGVHKYGDYPFGGLCPNNNTNPNPNQNHHNNPSSHPNANQNQNHYLNNYPTTNHNHNSNSCYSRVNLTHNPDHDPNIAPSPSRDHNSNPNQNQILNHNYNCSHNPISTHKPMRASDSFFDASNCSTETGCHATFNHVTFSKNNGHQEQSQDPTAISSSSCLDAGSANLENLNGGYYVLEEIIDENKNCDDCENSEENRNENEFSENGNKSYRNFAVQEPSDRITGLVLESEAPSNRNSQKGGVQLSPGHVGYDGIIEARNNCRENSPKNSTSGNARTGVSVTLKNFRNDDDDRGAREILESEGESGRGAPPRAPSRRVHAVRGSARPPDLVIRRNFLPKCEP